MAPKIRTARKPDLNLVLELYKHLHTADRPIDAEIAQENFDRIVSSSNLQIFLIELDGVATASCYLNVITNLTRGGAPYGVIENVVTHKDYRRRDLGKKIVDHALQEAWVSGCYKVMLMTGNAANIPFYEACGFDASAKSALVAYP